MGKEIKNKINAATNVEVHVSLLERSSLLQLVKEKNDLLVISEIPTHRTDFFYKIVAYLFYLSISGCKQCQLIHCQKRVPFVGSCDGATGRWHVLVAVPLMDQTLPKTNGILDVTGDGGKPYLEIRETDTRISLSVAPY